MNRRNYFHLLLLAAAVILIQLCASGLNKEFYLTQLTMSAYYSLVVLGLCLLMGCAGQASLGHGAFFAIGGYMSAVLTTHNLAFWQKTVWAGWLQRAGVLVLQDNLFDGTSQLVFTPWAAFLAAMVFTIVIAILVGYPSLRLKGHYLAMATLGFSLIVYRLLLASPLTGSADGINGVPPWPILPGLTVSGEKSLRISNYYLAWLMAMMALVLLMNLVHSRAGRALRAIHDGETAANAMGIDTGRFKLMAFVVSALLAAAAGSFLTHYNAGIGPSEASAMKSVRYVTLVAVGGMDNFWGSLLMSVLLNFLSLRGYFGTYDHAVFGIILILIISLMPDGPFKPLGNLIQRLSSNRITGGKEKHGSA